MKKILPISPVICCIACLVVPLFKITAWLIGYDFNLYNNQITIIAIAVLLFLVTVNMLSHKIRPNKYAIFATILLPISMINALFCISSANWVSTISIIVSCGCAIIIFGNYPSILPLKVISGFISMLLLLLLLFLSFIIYMFGDFGSTAVIKSVYNPGRTHVAEIIASDQGALGGDTFVDVKEVTGTINVLIGKFSKLPIRVYTGRWGEFEDMDIRWKDENTLIINSKAYNIVDGRQWWR